MRAPPSFFFFFILAKIGHMGKLILKVRLGQVHSSQGRRLDAGQEVRCWQAVRRWAGIFFFFSLLHSAKIGHIGKLILKVR